MISAIVSKALNADCKGTMVDNIFYCGGSPAGYPTLLTCSKTPRSTMPLVWMSTSSGCPSRAATISKSASYMN
jgi:hypothetical protein